MDLRKSQVCPGFFRSFFLASFGGDGQFARWGSVSSEWLAKIASRPKRRPTMNDMPSEIGCPSCGAYGFGCDCDRSELIEQRASKQRRDSPGPTVDQWPYLPADAVARLGLTRPAEYIQMVPPGWEREVAESRRRWARGR